MPNTNRRTARSARGGAAADSLYERLKQLRPVEQQEALEEQEAYWEEDDLQVGAGQLVAHLTGPACPTQALFNA